MYRCWSSDVSEWGGESEVFDGTHDFWREASAVGKMNDRVIKVVQICLVVRLELMKVIEEFEGEGGVRLNQCGWVPFLPDQLSATVGGVF